MTGKPAVSVLLCTHNPRAAHLNKTLAMLDAQMPLPDGLSWELVIVDNASDPPVAKRMDLTLPAGARVVCEPQLGLSHARRRSFGECEAPILVYVDDDNLLSSDYLLKAWTKMIASSELGALGGKIRPEFEASPPQWFAQTGIELAWRDLGPNELSASWLGMHEGQRNYPSCAPIGAGMILRRDAYAAYVEETAADPVRQALGRRGNDLASGEDNDMVMTILRNGWTVAYDPGLTLTHLIPASRLDRNYLCRYVYSSNRTWVQVLGVHGIRPWTAVRPSTAPLRKLRAFLKSKPWLGPVEKIAWARACGLIDGRARLTAQTSVRSG